MSNKMLYSAESWDKVYNAFGEINFVAYDFASVKQSLIDYIKLKYPENFNDYTDSSQLIAIISAFAYIAEQLAYRIDMATHENLISSAQRKQSILRLAKLIGYKTSRNLPLRGFVKIVSVSCSEDIRDSQGNTLANRQIKWYDVLNPLWKEQFYLVMNRLVTTDLSIPLKQLQVDDNFFKLYEINNVLESDTQGTSFVNGVLQIKVNANGTNLPFELVPCDVDKTGVFERSPNVLKQFSILNNDDGYGDSSGMTGFLMYMKQGTLNKLPYTFEGNIPDRIVDIDLQSINDTDVWLHEVSASGELISEWESIDNIGGENLVFNTSKNRKKYEIETLENDAIRLIFGAGDFSEIPQGYFDIWARTSYGEDISLTKQDLTDKTITFAYISKAGRRETCSIVISLVSTLQNASTSENIEHIRTVAPSVFYTQDRMVNGQDYNSYPLKDSSILKLKSVNRTFAGQGKLKGFTTDTQNVKIFGDDLALYYDSNVESMTYNTSSRRLIDVVLEPLLSKPDIINQIRILANEQSTIQNIVYTPRNVFFERSDFALEKTLLQGYIDRHWYGEPETIISLGPDLTVNTSPKKTYGIVNDADNHVYDAYIPLVVKTANGYQLADIPNGVSGIQESSTKLKRFAIGLNPFTNFTSPVVLVGGISNQANLTNADIISNNNDVLTITFNTTSTFTVDGYNNGRYGEGNINEIYDNGPLSFKVQGTYFVPGDVFVINLNPLSISQTNINGSISIQSDPLDSLLDVSNEWLMIVERADDEMGNLSHWKILTRGTNLVAHSPTTRFWYDGTSNLIDPETGLRVRDQLKLLKSNLINNEILGKDIVYNVVGQLSKFDGSTETSSVTLNQIDNGISNTVLQSSNWIYFKRQGNTWIRINTPSISVINLSYVNNITNDGMYKRVKGISELNFCWYHYLADDRLLDPSPTNIIDFYILTRGYYTNLQSWLSGLTAKPVPPTSFELRNAYRNILERKMISDTVVMRPANIKLVFGNKADPQLRAKFKFVKSDFAKLSSDQIKLKAVEIIKEFFDINQWEFGQTLYTTELISVLHAKLADSVNSVVLVPDAANSYFGDLLVINSEVAEIIMPDISINEITIVSNLSKSTIKQA